MIVFAENRELISFCLSSPVCGCLPWSPMVFSTRPWCWSNFVGEFLHLLTIVTKDPGLLMTHSSLLLPWYENFVDSLVITIFYRFLSFYWFFSYDWKSKLNGGGEFSLLFFFDKVSEFSRNMLGLKRYIAFLNFPVLIQK